MMDWTLCDAVEQDVEKVSGAWVFRGTRVPVTALFENFASGLYSKERKAPKIFIRDTVVI